MSVLRQLISGEVKWTIFTVFFPSKTWSVSLHCDNAAALFEEKIHLTNQEVPPRITNDFQAHRRYWPRHVLLVSILNNGQVRKRKPLFCFVVFLCVCVSHSSGKSFTTLPTTPLRDPLNHESLYACFHFKEMVKRCFYSILFFNHRYRSAHIFYNKRTQTRGGLSTVRR